MQIRAMQLGMLGANCYIFWDERTHKCAVVDPGDDGAQVAAALLGQGLDPVAVLLTHGHFDHILGVSGLRGQWPELPVYCHPADADPACPTVELFGSTFPSAGSIPRLRRYPQDGHLSVGPLDVEVLHTPGHSPGSVTLRVGDVLFTGDTLFRGSVGRTDLGGGDPGALLESLRKLNALPGDYRVYPGHEGPTTLDAERRGNPWMLQARRDG